ncbi:MAG TPA: hypothetical protein VNF68_12490, partial [Candidatus Baltobacteraceae bacterium]|nr:hypothetical protein [Candidatus Baltobacteraceae bacterium]
MHVRLGGLFSVALVAVLLASCSGGGGTPAPVIPYVPLSQSVQSTLTTSGGSLSFGAVSNGSTTVISSAGVTIPAVSAAGTVSATLTAAAPSGVPAPKAIKRPADLGGVANTPLAYIALTFAQNETFDRSPGVSVTFATAPAAGNAYLVVYSPTDGWNVLSGPVTISGATIAFPSAALAAPITLTANTPYVFAIVSTGSSVIPTPLPTINPSAAASYSGTKTIAFAYGYAFGYPAPGPTATAPPSSTSYTVTSTVSIGASPNPGSGSNTIDEHTVENDVSSLSTTTLATDAWVANGTSGNSTDAVLLYAMTQTEPSSANQPVITTTYNAAQTLDEFPETSGAAWTNSPQSNVAYSYASGNNGTRTINADGTFTDMENLLALGIGGTSTIVENNDGSGSIDGPFFGGGIINNVTVSAPASGNVNIVINYSTFAQTYYGLPPSVTIPDSTWYATPPVFYNETDAVTTGVNLPAGCTPNFYGSTANDVKRTINQLDTVMGDVETTILDTYTYNGLPVCLVSSDVVNYAYDWQNNT